MKYPMCGNPLIKLLAELLNTNNNTIEENFEATLTVLPRAFEGGGRTQFVQ